MNAPAPKRSNLISLSFPTKQALASAFLPYMKNGGLFIPGKQDFSLGDKVIVMVTALDGTKHPATGTVAWQSDFNDSNNGFAQGIGIHFDTTDACRALAQKLSSEVAGVKPERAYTL